MDTKKDRQSQQKATNIQSADEPAEKTVSKADIMYELERKNAAKLIGIERRQYLFVFTLILLGVTAGLVVFDVSYTLAAVIGGCGAMGLAMVLLSGPGGKAKPVSDPKSEKNKES